jgi:Esterase-like activity of phytase
MPRLLRSVLMRWQACIPRGSEQHSAFPRWCSGAILAVLLLNTVAALAFDDAVFRQVPTHAFQRIATFPVFRNTNANQTAVAEIVAASEDGNLLVYTDSAGERIGFVDITDPSRPVPSGVLAVGGEPTSVAVAGPYALVVVNTSPSFRAPSGQLHVVELSSHTIVRTIELKGQPDSIAVSPDRHFAAIVMENERDEDAGDGRPPQSPPGFLVIVDLEGTPAQWTTRKVNLQGVPALFPNDPEPEFVAINASNIAAVTLQENNHIVLVDLPSGTIRSHWSAGTVDLQDIDTVENELIQLNGTLSDVPREPDAVAWLSPQHLATADEGDLDGGSRGFTIYNRQGKILFTSGNALEHLATRIGHYPEDRSESAGSEPEGIAFGNYKSGRYLFVGMERANAVAVYRLDTDDHPTFVQVLPTGIGPEGLLAIPQRDLFVVASEEDSREDKFRAALTIYQLMRGAPTYPTIVSINRRDGLPIPWGALSGLAADHEQPHQVYTLYDSRYRQSRLFVMDVYHRPALITHEIILRTQAGKTLDLDAEGIAVRRDGGFWIVSEGDCSVDDPARPVTSRNLLVQVAPDGTVLQQIPLPEEVNALQRRFGFEGVAAVGAGDNERVYVAFQREWVDDPPQHVRIGRYSPASAEWRFFYYPLENPTSPNGGSVGLSELVALDSETFAVIERDDQGGTDARIKHIYSFSVAGLTPQPQGEEFPVVTKTLVRDLLPDLKADNGPVLEKVEGFTVTADGHALIVTDNDGLDDASGETQFLDLGVLFE